MNWEEILKSKGYQLAGRCAACGGWWKWTNGTNLIRVKSKFAKLRVDGKLQVIKLTDLNKYL